ncbi:MAG: hypothetical protein RSE91_00880 [Bacilli bacterium]
MIKIVSKAPLANNPLSPYTGAYFVCSKYILMDPTNSQIIEYDKEENTRKIIPVSSPYASITMDSSNNCFFMTLVNDKNKIYKTNKNYQEIDTINLNVTKEYENLINAIDFNDMTRKMMITNDKKVYTVLENGSFIQSEISNNAVNTLLGGNNVTLSKTVNYCGCSSSVPTCLKRNYFSCAAYLCDKKYVAYTRDNSSYIALISLNGNIISNEYVDDDIVINSMFFVNGKLQLLVTRSKKYNYIYKTDFSCCINENNFCKDHCCLDDKEYVEEICKEKSEEYMEIIDDKVECNDHISIIESIALIETALSHILNAEGEKIQKAIEMTSSTCELLEVNNSVNEVIKNVTFLEHVLYNKLELSSRCCKINEEDESLLCEEEIEKDEDQID